VGVVTRKATAYLRKHIPPPDDPAIRTLVQIIMLIDALPIPDRSDIAAYIAARYKRKSVACEECGATIKRTESNG
jgi:hypothetical protein